MRNILNGFFMAWGNFCWIPSPRKIWDEKGRKWMLATMPLIGLLIGFLQLSGYSIFEMIESFSGYYLEAAVVAVLPFFLSGFMHLEGFMDTTDALMSRRDRDEMQRILKDSRAGAFAVIGLITVMVIYFGSMMDIVTSVFSWELMFALVGVPFCARLASVLLLYTHDAIETSQYSGLERKDRNVKIFFAVVSVIVLAALISVNLILFEAVKYMIIAMAASFLFAYAAGRSAAGTIGGMNGDIAGYAVTAGEVAGAAVLALLS